MPGEPGVKLSPRVLRKLNARVVHQGNFAKQIGVHFVTISRVMTGTRSPSRSLLKKICHALDLEVEVRVVAKVWPKGERPTKAGDSLAIEESQEREI